MNRKQLLETNLAEDQNVTTVITNILAKDAKAFKKAKRDVEDELETAEEQLEERLSGKSPIAKATIEVTYANVKDLKAKLELYASFEKEFLKTE